MKTRRVNNFDCAFGVGTGCPFLGITYKDIPWGGEDDDAYMSEMRIGLCHKYRKVLETKQEMDTPCGRCSECLEDKNSPFVDICGFLG